MSGVRGRAGDYFVTRLSEHEWSGGGGEEKGMGGLDSSVAQRNGCGEIRARRLGDGMLVIIIRSRMVHCKALSFSYRQ